MKKTQKLLNSLNVDIVIEGEWCEDLKQQLGYARVDDLIRIREAARWISDRVDWEIEWIDVGRAKTSDD